MKRILVGVWLLAGCGAVEVAPVATAPALTKARDDGSSNPMPGAPPPVANAPSAPSDPAASNPMPGQPPVDDPLAPGASNPMPGINTGVVAGSDGYTR
jgi:hypothetical protein